MNKSPQQIITEIDSILSVIWNSLENPDILSREILKMSVLYAGLGNYLAEAREAERKAEQHYKFLIETTKLDYVAAGDSATVSESKAKVEAHEAQETYLQSAKRVDMLKLKREDVERILDATRSRLSLIKGDIRQAQ